MFDIGFPEFMVAAVVALVILGPQRLPTALRTLGLWLGRLRRSYHNVKTEIEREVGMDEVRRQLHNEQVMEDVRRVEREVQALGSDATGAPSAQSSSPAEGAAATKPPPAAASASPGAPAKL